MRGEKGHSIPTISNNRDGGGLPPSRWLIDDLEIRFFPLQTHRNLLQLHHQKHHQTYITNYNKALEQLHERVMPLPLSNC